MKMKKTLRTLLAVVLVVAMSMIAFGCSAGPSAATSSTLAETSNAITSASSTAVQKDIKVGISMLTMEDQILARLVTDAQARAKEVGATVLVNDCKNDANAQISAIDNFITSNCDVIIIQAANAKALDQVIDKAMAKGIKIMSLFIELDKYDLFYTNDEKAIGKTVGKMVGEWINKNYGGTAEIGLIEFPTIPQVITRVDGIKEALKETAPNAKIVVTGSAVDSNNGLTLAQNFLMAYPNIKVICSFFDAPLIGAYQAVKMAGKDNSEFALFGSDANPVVLPYIKDGTAYRGTVDLGAKDFGKNCIDYAMKLVKNEVTEKVVTTVPVPVTIDNIDQYYSATTSTSK